MPKATQIKGYRMFIPSLKMKQGNYILRIARGFCLSNYRYWFFCMKGFWQTLKGTKGHLWFYTNCIQNRKERYS